MGPGDVKPIRLLLYPLIEDSTVSDARASALSVKNKVDVGALALSNRLGTIQRVVTKIDL